MRCWVKKPTDPGCTCLTWHTSTRLEGLVGARGLTVAWLLRGLVRRNMKTTSRLMGKVIRALSTPTTMSFQEREKLPVPEGSSQAGV